jgi:FkbM family methyltransferase
MKKIFKKVYDLVPFKKEIFSFLKHLPIPEKMFRHLYFKGIFKLKINNKTNVLMHSTGQVEENQLFWKGLDEGWEKVSINLWKKLCLNSNVIFDIGANTGIYSLIAKAVNTNSKVYAFEPLPAVVDILKINNEINNFDIDCIPLAVSNFSSEAKVFLQENTDFAYSVTVNKSLLSKETPQKELNIKTITLNEFIKNQNIGKIDLMKIDVETHEPEVLEGFDEYLHKFLPDIIIEVWSEDTVEKINKILTDKRYLYFDIDDKNGIITQKDKIYVSSYWNYLVCKPETATYLGLIK